MQFIAKLPKTGSVRAGTNNCGNAVIMAMHDWEAYSIWNLMENYDIIDNICFCVPSQLSTSSRTQLQDNIPSLGHCYDYKALGERIHINVRYSRNLQFGVFFVWS